MPDDSLPRQFAPGDVLRYSPTGGTHARQCTAIVLQNGNVMDTFWGLRPGDGGHYLSPEELATAELVFNLNDYRKLGEHWEPKRDEWLTYAPADRQRVGSQGQWQSTYYVRIGAGPDLETQIENARVAVEDAVHSAERRLQWAREDLARLEASRVAA